MAELPVKATSQLVQCLPEVPSSSGFIVGFSDPDLGTFLVDTYHISDEGVSAADAADLKILLPYGWRVVGCFIKGSASQQLAATKAKDILHSVSDLLPSQARPVVALLGGVSQKAEFYEYSAASDLSSVADISQVDYADVQKLLVTFRCRCNVDLQVYTSDASSTAKGLMAAHQLAAAKLDAPTISFIVDGAGVNRQLMTTSCRGSVESLLPTSSPLSSSPPILTAQPVMDCTTSHGPPEDFAYDYQPVAVPTCKLQSVRVTLDVLCVVSKAAAIAQVVDGALQPALQRQLSAAVERLAALPALDKVQYVSAYHCQPPGRYHPVTMVYVHQSADLEAVESAHLSLRQRLHARLGLPADRPCLRLVHALPLESDSQAASTAPGVVQRLRNVHEGLTPPVPGGKVFLVDGVYDYHHYMQDKFNDAGWGCAYRSLQTICSWFRAQHFTNKPVPSHRQIQEILVKIGDKDSSFIGSSNWIGAIELSYILDEYMDVTCKIVTINRGEDIPTRARELAQHFVNQGTPVMIGGGVLAYTLMGVQLNEQTGECAFLILDPHYTGGEDLQKIHQGTWIAWKKYGDTAAAGGPLFVPDAFYNFLCPQRPKLV